jgi:ECF sigma factor
MNEVTRFLSAIAEGDPHAAAQLLPRVYEELRRLAAQRMALELLEETLEPTALVHEAQLRLMPSPGRESAAPPPHWNSRGHLFAAAAEAMRDILVERARSKGRINWPCSVKTIPAIWAWSGWPFTPPKPLAGKPKRSSKPKASPPGARHEVKPARPTR